MFFSIWYNQKYMISGLISWIQSLVISFGPIGVFYAGFLEEVIWLIPSSLVQMSFGFLLFQNIPFSFESLGVLFITVSIPAAIGVSLGTLPFYFLAYYGGRPLLDSHGKYIGLSQSILQKTYSFLEQKNFGQKALLVARILPVIPSTTTTLLFGIIRIHFVPYLFYTFLGTLVRVTFFAYIGWQFGLGYIETLKHFGSEITGAFFVVLILTCILFLIRRKRNLQAMDQQKDPDYSKTDR